MEKLLYISCVNSNDNSSGISRKVLSQYTVFCQSFDAYLLCYHDNQIAIFQNGNKTIIESGHKHRRIALMNLAVELVHNQSIERIYIRRMPCNPFVIKMLKSIHCDKSKILWEIPTYPYDYEFKSIRHKLIVRPLDKVCRRSLRKYIDSVVTFSSEKNIFGIPAINTGNGIDVEGVRKRNPIETDSIEMIAVAVLNNWHGYDRLIKGLAEYYSSPDVKPLVRFHLVGDGPCLVEYQKLAKNLDVDKYVVFYGAKTKSEVDDIYDKANLAVESLGWHRSNVTVGTSIKTREYVAKGLPILASSPMDIFPNGWEYAFYAPIDDSPINISDVVEFFQTKIATKGCQQLCDEIRLVANERCDMKAMMKPVISFFED